MTEPAPPPSVPAREEPTRPGTLRRALLYLLAFGLTTLAVTLFSTVLILPGGTALITGAGLYLAFEIPLAAAALALTLFFWRQLDHAPASWWGFHVPTARNIALAAAVALVPTLGGLGLDLAFVHAHIVRAHASGPAVIVGHLILYAVLGLAVGLAEETPFRGYLLPNLTQRLGAPAAILITSVLFASMHLVNPEHWKPLNMLELTLAGVGFALLRLGTGSLTIPVLAHACYDFVLFVVGTEREFQGVFRTEIGPYNLWLGGEESSGLVSILLLTAWVAALWRWLYLPSRAAATRIP